MPNKPSTLGLVVSSEGAPPRCRRSHFASQARGRAAGPAPSPTALDKKTFPRCWTRKPSLALGKKRPSSALVKKRRVVSLDTHRVLFLGKGEPLLLAWEENLLPLLGMKMPGLVATAARPVARDRSRRGGKRKASRKGREGWGEGNRGARVYCRVTKFGE